MNWVTGIVVFSIIWWTVLFVILPFGVQVSKTPEKGHADSAPVHPHLRRKFIVTTGISIVLFVVVWYVINLNPLDL